MKKCLILFLLAAMACSEKPKTFADIDLQGHRGARGLMPENTIPAFIKALELGVNTLEMDLVITADSQVLVSHEPFMSAEICMDSTGFRFPEELQKKYNIYEMTYDQVKEFDCGLRLHPRFPTQVKISASKPLLKEVIDAVNAYTKDKGTPGPRYNLEIKSQKETDGKYHPAVSVFSDLVYEVVDKKVDWEKVTIQSFDFRVLQYYKEKYPEVVLALLIENTLSWTENIDSLGFTPTIYSCDYKLLSSATVTEIQEAGMQVIPWTVNERADMDKLLEWGVDGIITDYPDRTK